MKTQNRAIAALVAAATLLVGAGGAAAAAQITGPGPLLSIAISEDLNCAIYYEGDAASSFYGDTACGTFAAYGGTLYGPYSVPAGSNAGPRTAWTQISQSTTGSGTSASPHQITTVVSGDALELEQSDYYVEGENSYRTAMRVTNTSANPIELTLYHAADCYLQDADRGYGEHNPATGSVICRAPDADGEHSSAGRIEEFVPLSGGSNFIYGTYSAVWAAVGSQLPFPDTINNGNTIIDNGMGLSWTMSLAPGASTSRTMMTNFSPLGELVLPTVISPDPADIALTEESVVTVTVENPNAYEQVVTSLFATLPENVDYVLGSVDGLAEPLVTPDGRRLSFSGPLILEPTEVLTFTFKVSGTNVGTGTLELNGSTESGVGLLDSSGSIAVVDGDAPPVDPEPVEVTLGNPVVTQAQCLASGEPSSPVVELPADTDQVAYSIDGDVAPGNTITITAAVTEGQLATTQPNGWTVDTERTAGAMDVELDTLSCDGPPVEPGPVDPEPVDPKPIDSKPVDPKPAEPETIEVSPQDPKITQATCTVPPVVTLPTQKGIAYTGVPNAVKAGQTFILVATPGSDYRLVETAGWTSKSDGTAQKQFKLTDIPASCNAASEETGEGLAATGTNPWMPLLAISSIALIGTGGYFAILRRRNS